MQINPVRNRFAIAYFRTNVIIIGRSSDITTDGVYCGDNAITIITGNVIGITVALIVTIASDTTQGNVTSAVIQLTGHLHVQIGRHRISFRQRSVIRGIDTCLIQIFVRFAVKVQILVRIGHDGKRIGIVSGRQRVGTAFRISPRHASTHKEGSHGIRSPFQTEVSEEILVLVAAGTVRIHERTVSTPKQEVLYLSQTLHIIVSIIISGTHTEIHLLGLNGIVQTQFLAGSQAVVSSPLRATTATESSVAHIVGSTDERKLAALVSMAGKTVDIGTGRITLLRTQSAIQVTHPSLVHTLLHGEVEHGFFFTVVNAGNTGIVRLSVVSIDFVHHVHRQVLETGLHVATEEFLAVHQQLLHFLTVDFHITFIVHFGTRQFLHQFFQSGSFRRTVSRGIVSQGIARHGYLRSFRCNYRLLQHDGIR